MNNIPLHDLCLKLRIVLSRIFQQTTEAVTMDTEAEGVASRYENPSVFGFKGSNTYMSLSDNNSEFTADLRDQDIIEERRINQCSSLSTTGLCEMTLYSDCGELSTRDFNSSETNHSSLSLPDIQGNVRESGQGKIDLERTSLSTTGYCPMTLYSDRSHCNRSGCLESLDSQSESATQHSASPTPVSSNEPQPNWCDANLSPKEGVYPKSVPMSS